MSESAPFVPSVPAAVGEYVVIARRYRPQTFEELVGQEHVARALQQAIVSDRVGHAYLFTGARGVGKTSAARILAKALNCVNGPTPTPCNECDVCQRVSTGDDVDVLEIDGASNRGIDEIRQLRQNVAVLPSRVRYKIYIIDEVHMLTKEAFNALLKTLEEPPEHVKFVFATTEPQKIPITILSRCQRFDFAGISASAIQGRLMQIAQAEGVDVEPEAVQIIAARAAGSMRDSQSLLEQLLAVADERITAKEVNELLGIAPVQRLSGLVRQLVAHDAAAALAELDGAIRDGVEVGQLLDQLVGYFRDVMAAAVGCDAEQMLYALPSQVAEVKEVGRGLGLQTILAIAQILDQTAARLRLSTHGRTLVEVAIVQICQLDKLDDLATLVAELRGEVRESAPRGTAAAMPTATAPAAKKNDEPIAANLAAGLERQLAASGVSVGSIPPVNSDSGSEAQIFLPLAEKEDAPPQSAMEIVRMDVATDASNGANSSAPSVLREFQRAINDKSPSSGSPASPPAPRASRREQMAAVAEKAFVKRAMELFDVPPGQLRYTSSESE